MHTIQQFVPHRTVIQGECTVLTAYEIGVRLVGSEMCIRDRLGPIAFDLGAIILDWGPIILD